MIVSQCSDIGLDNLNLTVAQTRIWSRRAVTCNLKFEPPGRGTWATAGGQ